MCSFVSVSENGLGALGMKEATRPLLSQLKDADRMVRLNTILALGRSGVQEAFGPLIALLNDPDIWISVEAVIAPGRLSDARAVPVLVQMGAGLDGKLETEGKLGREEETLHKAILQALAKFRNTEQELILP